MKLNLFKPACAAMSVILFGSIFLNNNACMSGYAGKIVYASETTEILEDSELAEALIENGVTGTNHVERLEIKEPDLNTIIYANYDGTETAYIFDEEVKYIDDNGEIQDKSNEITEADSDIIGEQYSYFNEDNDINTYFPDVLSEDSGIFLNSDGFTLEMMPNTDAVSGTAKLIDNTVVYPDIFGEKTELRYETTFNGFKEDIVLYENCGNVFSFTVNAQGTYPENENGAINFVDKNSGEVKAVMSPIYVYDSYVGDVPEGETHYTYANSLEFRKIYEDIYEITITVDRDFLENEATVYPVYVDPSTTVISATSTGTKTVLDTPIYNGSGAANVTAGANTTGVIGYVNASYGSGRMLMKFPSLSTNGFISSKYTILGTFLYLKDVSGQSSSATITAYNYTGPSWNESTVYSSSVWNGVGTSVGSATFSSPSNVQKSIDITSAVKKWQTDSTAFNKGLILKNTTSETSTTYYKSICTSENSSFKSYLVVTYFYHGVRPVTTMPATTENYRNCFCYAFNQSQDMLGSAVGAASLKLYNMTVEDALKTTRMFMEGSDGKSGVLGKCFPKGFRVVSGYDAALEQDEWLVCMRVGVEVVPIFDNFYDYHFWYRASDGKWYNKHGWRNASECVDGVVNPSTANNSTGWALDYITNFYSSETIYYAVKQ